MPHLYIIGASWTSKRNLVCALVGRDVLEPHSKGGLGERSTPLAKVPITIIPGDATRHQAGDAAVTIYTPMNCCSFTVLPSKATPPPDATGVIATIMSSETSKAFPHVADGIPLCVCVVENARTKPEYDFAQRLQRAHALTVLPVSRELPAQLLDFVRPGLVVCLGNSLPAVWTFLCWMTGQVLLSQSRLQGRAVLLTKSDRPPSLVVHRGGKIMVRELGEATFYEMVAYCDLPCDYLEFQGPWDVSAWVVHGDPKRHPMVLGRHQAVQIGESADTADWRYVAQLGDVDADRTFYSRDWELGGLAEGRPASATYARLLTWLHNPW